MNGREDHTESGQVLVTVAVAMVVILLFLALAVDVGSIYQERRLMQNAADAGALRGAYEICYGDPNAAESTARDYAQRNGAQVADVTIIDGYTVNVVATKDSNTIFAGVVGIDTVNVGAVAEAVCGSARSACGLWPIALAEWRWDELKYDCGRMFYVWSGDNANQQPDCTVYDCNVDGDPAGKEDIVDMLQRAWLDFSDVVEAEHPDDCVAPGCGAAELECWIRNDSGAEIEIGECLAGDTGVKVGVKDGVNSRFGDMITIPIFKERDCMGVTCPGTSIRVSGWACIRIIGWDQSLELPRLDGANPPWKGPVIAARVDCDTCVTYCGKSEAGPPPPGGAKAVSLTK